MSTQKNRTVADKAKRLTAQINDFTAKLMRLQTAMYDERTTPDQRNRLFAEYKVINRRIRPVWRDLEQAVKIAERA